MERIRLTGSILRNENEFSRREWLITNGVGGFAGSSLVGANTRGYHGLLIAALKPPLQRLLLVGKLDEEVLISGREYLLATNIYENSVYPQGFNYLAEFSYSFHPTFTYELDGCLLEKKVYMCYGENTTIVEYTYVDGSGTMTLQLTPFLNYRDYHGHTTAADWPWDMAVQGMQYSFIAFAGAAPIYLTSTGEWNSNPHWQKNLFYPLEKYRGLNSIEDHYVPGNLTINLQVGQRVGVVFSTLNKYWEEPDLDQIYLKEQERIMHICQLSGAEDWENRRLVIAADQFLVYRESSDTATVIAGYPWFTDWGRDSMIALPGLTLATGRYKEGKEILETFIRYSNYGLIPNRFPDEGEDPEYNTVDATLWFFIAFYQYFLKTVDLEFVKEHLSLLKQMILRHQTGTLWGIKMTDDYLLTQGEEEVQLTWMDAMVGDWVVTPRQGKAVEINALWYNALKIISFFCQLVGEDETSEEYEELADKVLKNFRDVFWNEAGGYLYDCVTDMGKDSAIRPNQIFALSLPFPLLDVTDGIRVLGVIKEHLLTPVGLRSLSDKDLKYHGNYGGDQYQRDAAYHQGTVWSWLMGPYLGALWYVENARGTDVKEKISKLLQPLLAHLESDGAIGQVSEIFDGNRPYHHRGCYAQAWSIGEILRIKDLIS